MRSPHSVEYRPTIAPHTDYAIASPLIELDINVRLALRDRSFLLRLTQLCDSEALLRLRSMVRSSKAQIAFL